MKIRQAPIPADFLPECKDESERRRRWEIVEREQAEIVLSGIRRGYSLHQIGFQLLNYWSNNECTKDTR